MADNGSPKMSISTRELIRSTVIAMLVCGCAKLMQDISNSQLDSTYQTLIIFGLDALRRFLMDTRHDRSGTDEKG
jgi:hypothetical protein